MSRRPSDDLEGEAVPNTVFVAPSASQPPPAQSAPMTPGEAVRLKAQARRKRALAPIMRERWGDATGARFEAAEAAQMDARADAVLDPANHALEAPRQGNGGELVLESPENQRREWAMDTLKTTPDMLNADASAVRLDLAAGAGSLTLAIDMAQSVQAANSMERALAHQMATVHQMAMTMAAKAAAFTSSISPRDSELRQQVQSIEAARMANTAARLMETFQRGALTLERLKNGGKQTVVVQHVAVGDGGQAVVAGTMNQGEGPK